MAQCLADERLWLIPLIATFVQLQFPVLHLKFYSFTVSPLSYAWAGGQFWLRVFEVLILVLIGLES
jgi:hypothetical protein